jgi:nucleoside-diphosphate-sugar epimerase
VKVLVIGGTRFVGYHLVHELLANGHDVTIFTRGKTPDDFGSKIHRLKGDRTDHQGFIEIFKNLSFDVVVDMIAFREKDSIAAIEAFEGKIKHFIHISTRKIYLISHQNYAGQIKEEYDNRQILAPPKDKRMVFAYNYGLGKKKCEAVLQKAFQRNQFPVTILRPPFICGERDNYLRDYSYFLRIKDGNPLILVDGGGKKIRNVYVRDVARAINSLMGKMNTAGKVFNIAQEEILSIKEYLGEVSQIMGRKLEIIDIPKDFLGQNGVSFPYPYFSPFNSELNDILDIEKIKKELDFDSTPFKVWMRDTIRWFDNQYKGSAVDNYKNREKEVELIRKFQLEKG